MNETELTQNEDEISLIDLFAVVIRHRIMIVIGTIIITFIAGVYLFVAPMLSKKFDKSAVTVSYNVKVNTIPPSIMQKLPNAMGTPSYLARYNATRIQFLVDEFKAFPVFNDENNQMSEYEFNGHVQQILSKKQYNVKASELGSDFDIIMDIPLEKIPVANELVQDVVAKTEVELQNNFKPLIEELEDNTNTSIKKAKEVASSTTDMSSLQNLQNLQVEIEKYKSTHTNFLELKPTPFVIPQAQGRVKKLIIVCLASFFIFIFIAFLMNAVENVKADPDASKVISDAWNSGKRSKK